MKFFVPTTTTPESAEQLYEAIKAFAKDTLQWQISDRKIFRIAYVHDGKAEQAEVGKRSNVNHEEVLAILESNAFLVCTPNRGGLRGGPILVGTGEVRGIEDFT
jgi:hypothetical protein